MSAYIYIFLYLIKTIKEIERLQVNDHSFLNDYYLMVKVHSFMYFLLLLLMLMLLFLLIFFRQLQQMQQQMMLYQIIFNVVVDVLKMLNKNVQLIQ
jgi:hypothetical protein